MSLLRNLVARLGIGVLAALSAGCSEATVGHDRVLLVVTDATHAATLSCYGNPRPSTPNIDRIAEGGVRFARAFSNNTWTLPSTGSLMTGRLQESHGAVTNKHRLPPSERTLAESFADAGYRTAAFVQMGYASGEFGMDQGFREFSYYGEARGGKRGGVLPDIQRWLEANVGERWFVYLHLRRPHSPYRPNPEALAPLETECPLANGSRNEELEFADLFGARELEAQARAHARHLYEGNVNMADRLLRAVLPLAESQDALIVLTSDHGEAMGQHGVYGHGAWLFAESIDIPLVFWWPGAEPRVDLDPASTIDVFPTLVELCGLDSAGAVDGSSLAARLSGSAPSRAGMPVMVSARYTDAVQPRVGVVEGDWKLVLESSGPAALYNRRDDAGDLRDRASDEPELAARLTALAERWREEHADAATSGLMGGDIDPDVEADLQAIGYGGED